MEKKDCADPICFKSTDSNKAYQNYSFSKYHNQIFKFDEKITQKDDQQQTNDHYKDCPNNRDSLGFFTWNFLHTMAIYYPIQPNKEDKELMNNFLVSFAHFYPCKQCSIHFKNDIKNYPPAINSNKELSMWFCDRHNEVNKWLGKPIFDCSFENLEKRWKKGYDHCQNVTKL